MEKVSQELFWPNLFGHLCCSNNTKIYLDAALHYLRNKSLHQKFQLLTVEKQPRHQRCFVKKSVLRNFEKFIRKHLCQSILFNNVTGLRPEICNFIKKATPEQLFFCKLCETSKNTYFAEHLRMTASGLLFILYA